MIRTTLRNVTRRSLLVAVALFIPKKVRASPAYVIAAPCLGVKDAACVDVCPVDCIHPTKTETDFKKQKMLYINPVACIDCGACVPICPVKAVFPLDDLPKKWAQYAPINANYYKLKGSPSKEPSKKGSTPSKPKK
jgi:ferredoxin